MKIRLLLCHLRLSAFIFAYIHFFFGIPCTCLCQGYGRQVLCIPVEELCLSLPAGKRNVFILPACLADIPYVLCRVLAERQAHVDESAYRGAGLAVCQDGLGIS